MGPHFGFPNGKSRQQIIHDELREVADRLRSNVPQPFYSMREIANHFQVPLGTVSRVYKRLENECIISRIRSSHTMLMGRNVLPRTAVRGVVGIYIWLRSMINLPYTSSLVMGFEQRLRRIGYVTDVIFHSETNEEITPAFASRLLEHPLDIVVLHTPLPGSRQNILSLREHGIRVIVVQRKDSYSELPALMYLQDYLPAYQQMALRWREVGIRQVLICTPPACLHNRSELNIFRRILQQHGLKLELSQDSPRTLLKKFGRRTKKVSNALAFLDGDFCEKFCNLEPQAIEQLSRVVRLAFCVGAVRLPYLQSRQIKADVVDFSPTEIVSRISSDIGRLSVLADGVCHTFTAHYQEQIALYDDVREA